ncbi:ankyrin repeat domain-containing protein [Candidatus Cardinium hertigii]|jgi:ankyrin repeat protein|uniref:Ankyrin repeat domain-containing protein n=1 Tax=Candidatus Cardinium hertigii TaxID=247481 RepID=A0A3N2QD15_9BACT|nr:ankyrin repeat domain-containing protein [Candidatus Cardinium hertigii]ROT47667.1 ankyrin repeat domain-containing protein [Candidatus Cardinium hertigii]
MRHKTLLQIAVSRNATEYVTELLSYPGIDVTDTVLSLLCVGGHEENELDCLKYFINVVKEHNPNKLRLILDTRDEQGNTPLHMVAKHKRNLGDEFAVALLLDNIQDNTVYLDINAQNNQGLTALHIAIQTNNYEVMDILIQAGADINHTECSKCKKNILF